MGVLSLSFVNTEHYEHVTSILCVRMDSVPGGSFVPNVPDVPYVPCDHWARCAWCARCAWYAYYTLQSVASVPRVPGMLIWQSVANFPVCRVYLLSKVWPVFPARVPGVLT